MAKRTKRTTIADLDRLGQRLKRVLATNKAYDAMDGPYTWLAGACWILAQAFRGWIVRSFPDVVTELRFISEAHSGLPHHVVVEVETPNGGLRYFDGRGSQTYEDLLQYWSTEEGIEEEIELSPFNRELAIRGGIVCPRFSVLNLQALFDRELVARPRAGRHAEHDGTLPAGSRSRLSVALASIVDST